MSDPFRPRDHFPAQAQLLFPLLEELNHAGGEATTRTLCDALADRVGLDAPTREARVAVADGHKTVNAFDRTVRFVQLRARLLGFVHAPSHGVWRLTGPGEAALHNCRPGVVVVVWETEQGVALWADAQTAAGVLHDGAIDLLITSTPYPLIRQKAYEGQLQERQHIQWLLGVFDAYKTKIAETGSLVINVADTWLRGIPAQSAWVERFTIRMLDELGFFKAQAQYWNNTAAMPAPAEWVTIRRQRLKPEVEHCLWFVKDPHRAKANNANVQVPYSDSMRRTLDAGGECAQTRPSGHHRKDRAFSTDNGGAIAGNILRAANTDSNSRYLRLCRERGLPIHPARFPAELPERFIRLTTDPGDLVADPMSGSCVTAEVAERLGRRFIVGDIALTYLLGGGLRMNDMPGFRSHLEGAPDFPSLRPDQANLFAA